MCQHHIQCTWAHCSTTTATLESDVCHHPVPGSCRQPVLGPWALQAWHGTAPPDPERAPQHGMPQQELQPSTRWEAEPREGGPWQSRGQIKHQGLPRAEPQGAHCEMGTQNNDHHTAAYSSLKNCKTHQKCPLQLVHLQGGNISATLHTDGPLHQPLPS